MRRVVLIVALVALVAGCGMKGPLYLPGSKPESKRPAKTAPPVMPQTKVQEP